MLTDVTPDMAIVQDEVFGPVVTVSTFTDEADSVALANASVYGLGAAIWTRDVKRAHRVAQQLDAGIIWVNDHHRNDPSSPWGGMKHSGIGYDRRNRAAAYATVARTKRVHELTTSRVLWQARERTRGAPGVLADQERRRWLQRRQV